MLDRLHDAARLRTNPIIFFSAVAIVLGFVLCSLLFTETMNAVFVTGAGWVMENLGWFYILGVSVFLLFLIASNFPLNLLDIRHRMRALRRWPCFGYMFRREWVDLN